MKICTRCKEDKPISEFYKHKTGKNGITASCRACTKEYGRDNYVKNKEVILEKARKYYQENPEKMRKRAKEKYQKNRVQKLEHAKKYQQENRERLIEYLRIYREKNPESAREHGLRYYRENKEAVKLRVRNYNKTEAGRSVRSKGVNKYRALRAGVTVEDFTSKEIFRRDRYICQACGIKTRPDYKNIYHIKYPNLDHIIPISKGGEHSRRNTQCLCRGCNSSKGSRHANDQMLLIG